MKKITILFSFLLFFCGMANGAFAQSTLQTTDVKVVYSGAQTPTTFEDVSRFYFQNDNLVLDQHGTLTQIPVNTIHKLELAAISTPISGVADWNGNPILVYPNPTSDKLFFAAQEEQQLQVGVYSMGGQQLILQQLSTNESLDVSSLSKGLYIIKINNETYKFSKL